MNWLDRYVIGAISPRWALSRLRAARMVRAYYEGGEPSQYRKRRTDRSSANVVNQRGAVNIRIAARDLDENYDIGSGILDVLVANTVGTGIWPEPQILLKDGTPAQDLNTALLKLFEDWRYRPEVTWQYDYFGLQRIMARSYFRDGEVFGNRLTGIIQGLNHGTIVPYSIEALEADFVSFDANSIDPPVIQGVELNAWGRPAAYYVYKQHPGESSGLRGMSLSGDTKRVPAQSFLHLALRKRLHQVRGVSIFATVVNRLQDIKDIDECERVAAKVAASMAAFIKKGSPDNFTKPGTNDQAASGSGRRNMQFEAGLIFDDLEEGEDVGTIDTKRPNNALIPFRDANMRAVASGIGGSFSSVSKNYLGTYSAQRQELVEQYQTYQMAAGPLIYGGAQPIWEGFVDAAIAAGLVKAPSSVDETTLWDCTHTGPAMPWIDPESEMNAQILAMQWKLTSRSRVIRKSGANPDQINREIVRDDAEAKKLGIDISGPPAGTAPLKDPDPNSRIMRRDKHLAAV